jgi:hypothetical protein
MFPSSRYLSSSGSYPLDLSGVGEPAGSNAIAGLALRFIGTHKLLHHDKVEIPSWSIGEKITNTKKSTIKLQHERQYWYNTKISIR